jgi:hypothetical protein
MPDQGRPAVHRNCLSHAVMRQKPKGMGGERMRWRLILSVLIGIGFCGVKDLRKSFSQEQSALRNNVLPISLAPSKTGPNKTGPNKTGAIEGQVPIKDDVPLLPDFEALILKSKVARFRLILGRLSLDPPAHIKCERVADLTSGLGTEKVEVTARRGIPSLHYRFETELRNYTVDVSDAEHVRILSRRNHAWGTESLLLEQPGIGPIKLTLTTEDFVESAASPPQPVTDEFQVPSLVHLQAMYPSIYSRHVSPLLARLLDTVPASCQAEDLLNAIEPTEPDRREDALAFHLRVHQLVDALRSPERKARNHAENELKRLGLPALRLLDAIAMRGADLDGEQTLRLDRVRESLRPRGNDTPHQLARWLASDIAYWNTVAQELTIMQVQAVTDNVALLTGQPLRPQIRVADAKGVWRE